MTETVKRTSTKGKLLESAEDLILLGGYHGTGTNAIIENASVSKGSFFYHFPDKKSLGIELIQKYAAESLFAPLQRNLESFPDSAMDGLFAFTNEIEEYYLHGGHTGGCLLGNLALELSDSEPEIASEIAKAFAKWRSILLEALSTSRFTISKDHFVTLFIASLEGITMTIKAHKNKAKAAEEFAALRSFIALSFDG